MIHVNNLYVKEEITREIRNYYYKNTAHQNLWNTV